MTFRFAPNAEYPYAAGSLFLGVDPAKGFEVGIRTERHALTIAGARSGKGAALIIPNLLRWPENALVIDPKGEAAEQTAEARAAMGQEVHILAPFADVPHYRLPAHLDRFRAKLNPLADIDPAALDAREDVNVIADGLMMRHDPRAGHWDGGAASVISGVIAHQLSMAPAALRTLPEMRRIMTLPQKDFAAFVEAMSLNRACGNLPAAGAAKLLTSGTESGHFLSNAHANTHWLDSPAMDAMLSESSNGFRLADLKTKPCTVYLVLPPDLIAEHSRFLRLFVRMALRAMAKGGTGGRRCLFMLDEFYSLGHIDEIAKAAGAMPGYGVSLWPVLQDLGQLEALYGREMMHSFFGNADAHIFFGNTDAMSLGYLSDRMGVTGIEEIGSAPVQVQGRPMTGQTAAALFSSGGHPAAKQGAAIIGGAVGIVGAGLHTLEQAIQQHQANDYAAKLQTVGRPRMPPDQVREIIGKKDGDKVARSMIVIAKGHDVLNIRLAPYFEPPPSVMANPPAATPFQFPTVSLPKVSQEFKKFLMKMFVIAVAIGWMTYAFGYYFPEESPYTNRRIIAKELTSIALSLVFAFTIIRGFFVWRKYPADKD